MATGYQLLVEESTLDIRNWTWSIAVNGYNADRVLYQSPPVLNQDGSIHTPGVLAAPLPPADIDQFRITGSLLDSRPIGDQIAQAIGEAARQVEDLHRQRQAAAVLAQTLGPYLSTAIPISVKDLGE